MKSSPDLLTHASSTRRRLILVTISTLVLTATYAARADLPEWMQSVVSGSAIEAALYRVMELPGLRTLYQRPPAEARTQLNSLVAATPSDAALYALRAHVDEQALDFTAAAADWQAFVAHSTDKAAANFALADFYHRRNDGPQEIATLEAAAALPSAPDQKFLAADRQQAWQAFPRALTVADEQALGDATTIAIYRAWIARYPTEAAARANFITALLNLHRFDDTQQAIAAYKTAFPADQDFPIKAAALLAFDEGTPTATAQALALFDQSYQPLWPSDLIATYFELLAATHTQHEMLAATRTALAKNPDDLVAATKIFAYYQQQGHSDAALNSLAEYAASKNARHANWSPDELYTFATLLDRASQYQQAVRYYFALGSTSGRLGATAQSPEEAGLTGLIHVLLAAPDQPIELGAGNLSIYRDLATTDQGPGYFNGILSLWLNSQDPAAEFAGEEQKATPYFHRAKAAELLTLLDQHFPTSPARPALHAALIQAYAEYGQDAAIQQTGQAFLTDFPQAPQRLQVALTMADADARANDTNAEFALYESLLAQLSTRLQGMPLTAANATPAPQSDTDGVRNDTTSSDNTSTTPTVPSASALLQQSLTVPVNPPATTADATAYTQILNRYLGRLTATNQLPAALTLLRRELDRNPNDPLLYERLASFLQQNNLAAQQEEVYQQAIARFNDTTFYDKLARFYLRQKRQADFSSLTRKVVDIFHGTDLENYFANVATSWPQEYLQLNLYAHQRFPHDLVFTRNLLTAYQSKATADPAAAEQLLRQHWQESSDLQSQFFELLSRTNRLSAELTALGALVPTATQQQQDPAATRELAELDLWQSHFEQGAPLLAQLAEQYPANATVGDEAASVFRSLAYFDPTQIIQAVAIEKHLSAADPTNLDRLAAIGDTYADSTDTSLNLDPSLQLAQAAPFWHSMADVHPGLTDGYLQAATVFWDYFQFDAALSEIDAARKQFNNPTLYGYEAGAIDEDKRDLPCAIAEYTAAAIAPANSGDPGASDAGARLLVLASRPQTASLVDDATSAALARNPSLAALQLRIDVFTVLNRHNDIASTIEAAIARATTTDSAAQLADYSQAEHLPNAYQAALQREISLSADPVQQIQLDQQLVRSYVDQHNLDAAQHIVAAVYAANPKILGVVRFTVDFYWNNKQPQRAIATLLQASRAANPTLARDFLLEAIDKSSHSGDASGARALLQPLLAAEPFNPQYLSLEAQSFSLAHDNAGLRDFYTATIASINAAALSAADKRNKIALARQGLIPALTGLKSYSGAMDQYIALISAFPEDAATLQQASAYASLHSLQPQLVAFLQKTVAASPRDSRFAIDLGRIDVQFGDYAGALAAYSHAIAIRADRPDLFIARADLEEHQQLFDAACADYARLYVLTYDDPQWMQKAALARARQDKPELAAKALQTAWFDGHTPTAADNFRVAEQLAQWNFLSQADPFATEAVKLAGNDLLKLPENNDGAIFYARLLARERKAPELFTLYQHLLQAGDDSPSSPSVIAQQVAKNGLADVTDSDWRTQLVAVRRKQAESTYRASLLALGSVVAELYTPEEQSSFAALLTAQRANRPAQEIADLWIPAARAANLRALEAQWRRDVLLNAGGKLSEAQLAPFEALENQRMDYAALAQTLDTLAASLKGDRLNNVLARAATAWRSADNPQRETLDLHQLVVAHGQQQYRERLFDLYLHGDPAALLQLTASNGSVADAAANFILAHGVEPQALQAVANRAATRPPVWKTATTALTGLYFGDTSPAIDADFQAALANDTIGQRLAAKPDPDQQLVGNPWFYYGTRYGVFLTLAPKPSHDPEDYLAAELELAPSDPASYSALAQAYRDGHNPAAAILEYRHVIELNPTSPAPDIDIADIEWDSGQHPPALAQWNVALTKLRAMVDLTAVPEEFWISFAAVANDAASRHICAQLKPAMTAVLATYIRKNNDYRTPELLHSAYIALAPEDPTAATVWVLSLIGNASSNAQSSLLSQLPDLSWFLQSQLGAVYLRAIALDQTNAQIAAQAADANTSAPDATAPTQLTLDRTSYIRWLLTNSRPAAEAQQAFNAIAAPQRQSDDLQTLALLLAAKQSTVPALLASYEADPATAPSLDIIASAANTLRLQHDPTNSRLLLEYIFVHKLAQQSLTSADYLALAEARLATDDLPGALDLLHRLTLQGDLYANLDSAATLLVRTGHIAEALPFLTELANTTPWDASYRLRLGQAQLALHQTAPTEASLTTVASDEQSAYADRAAAALALRPLPSPKSFNGAELTLLANTTPTLQQASQPFFLFARITAATAAPLPQRATILRAAIEIAPRSMLPWLRLRLFQAEISQNHFDLASIAIAPVLTANPALRNPTPGSTSNAAYDSPATAASYTAASALPTQADKLAFVLSLALMDQHLDNDTQAIADLDAALKLTTDAARKTAFNSRIHTLQTHRQLDQQNAVRRPVIHKSIEQTALVRPRATASAPVSTEAQP